jgi:anion-transporting  ArsA/GET3 family ATPase
LSLERRQLFERRVLVCVGCGGVGKTSVAAVLSVAAARAGKRVLALTIDPAGRLADSLGVDRRSSVHQSIAPERLARLGITGSGQLSVGVLDAQRTLTEMVERLAPDEQRRRSITSHPLFRYLADYLAGTNEFMAMEKLLETLALPEYDLIVLDTPPTRHALDFLRAPGRLKDAIGGPIIAALVRAVDGSRRFSVDWVAKGVAGVVRGIGRLTGAGTLEQVATLLWELSAILGGMGERAERVDQAFRDPSFAYVLVTRPVVSAIDDALFFSAALAERDMSADMLVVNRVHSAPTRERAARGLDELSAHLEPGVLQRVAEVVEIELGRVERERKLLGRLDGDATLARSPKMTLPALAGGVTDLAGLSVLADSIA